MNNLIQNYEIILKHLINTCSHIETSRKIRTPKLSDLELVALNITAEYMSINYELHYLNVFQRLLWTEKLKEACTTKEKENFFLTSKK